MVKMKDWTINGCIYMKVKTILMLMYGSYKTTIKVKLASTKNIKLYIHDTWQYIIRSVLHVTPLQFNMIVCRREVTGWKRIWKEKTTSPCIKCYIPCSINLDKKEPVAHITWRYQRKLNIGHVDVWKLTKLQ